MIDPDKAADDYRERVIAPCVSISTETQVGELREELAGACTVESAAFDELSELLARDEQSLPFDHALFGTEPTRHTLGPLSPPRAWSGFLESTTEGASSLAPHSGLEMQETRFGAALEWLADGKRATIVPVARPDHAALHEADRPSGELVARGIQHHQRAVNAVFEATDRTGLVALALEQRGRTALCEMRARLSGPPSMQIPLRPFNMVGLPALRALLEDGAAAALARAVSPVSLLSLPPLWSLLDQVAAPDHGLVMVMGNGGVQNTTIAASIAAELASRRHDVHSSTTEPAAHSTSTLDGQVQNVTVSRIDPAAETKACVDHAMGTRGAKLDDAGSALLAEDLRSPCYEAAAVFAAFSRVVPRGRPSFGWVIERTPAAAGSTDPCSKPRVAAELEQIEVGRGRHAQRIAMVPWATEEPVSPGRLPSRARGEQAERRRASASIQ